MTEFHQTQPEEEAPLSEDNANLQQISNVSEMSSASALFDQANHTEASGVKRASATLDNGLVSYQGLELPRSVAEQLGIVAPQVANPINYEINVEGTPDTVVENTDSAEDVLADIPMLSEEQTSLLDAAISFDGGAVDRSIQEVLSHGDISENTLNDLVRASGASEEAVQATLESVSTNLDKQIEALTGIGEASELMRLASEATPKLVKASLMSAINGDVSSAKDLVTQTYANLDMTSYRAELEHSLSDAGYNIIEGSGGNLVIQGNDISDPMSWSVASSLFDISFK